MDNNKRQNSKTKKVNIFSQKIDNESKIINKSNKIQDIPKNKNNIKYEDKFYMMNEDDIDIQKRNRYKSNNNKKEELERSYKNEDEVKDVKEWNYTKKLVENKTKNEIIDYYYINNDDEENIKVTKKENEDYNINEMNNKIKNGNQINDKTDTTQEDLIIHI